MCSKHFYNAVKLRAIQNAWHVAIAKDAAATTCIRKDESGALLLELFVGLAN